MSDPYYDRKPVPTEFIEHVGYTGLTPQEEFTNRERKYSVQGGDVRRFSNPKGDKEGTLDPYYQRKKVPDSMIQGVGETGLTAEEEYQNRERKYSVNGVDVRRFSNSSTGFLHPTSDPFYGRKSVHKSSLVGVGQTGMTKAEEFETRENKTSLFDLSSDPFAQLTGSGHRASVAGPGAAAAAAQAARRRSSAVGPDGVGHDPDAKYHSGYAGDKLGPIQSKPDDILPSATSAGISHNNPFSTTATDTTATSMATTGADVGGTHTLGHQNITGDPAANVGVRDGTGHAVGTTGHTTFYDAATEDPDSVAPHEIR